MLLAKQCLIGIGGDQLAFIGYLTMVAMTGFLVLGLTPNGLQAFYTI
jgi:hypothetical protein